MGFLYNQSHSSVELNPVTILTALMHAIGSVEPLTWILLSSAGYFAVSVFMPVKWETN